MSQILRVYNTEANALAGGTSGLITSTTVDTSDAGAIENSVSAIPYYIYNRYYYRIEANEPVKEFHIDWDDGEDNSPDKRNIEIIKLEKASDFAVTEHVYTEAKRFFPLVRVRGINGFLSKWYTNDCSDNSFTELEPTSLSAGQNESSRVTLEKADSDRIPQFLPSNLPPIGILKSDRKRIFTGIDNKHIDALTTTNYPLLYAYTDSSESLGSSNLVKLTVQTRIQDKSGVDLTTNKTGAVREFILTGDKIVTADGDLDQEAGSTGELATKAVPTGNHDDGDGANETTVFQIKTNSGAGGGASDIEKADLTGDSIIIFSGGLPYLIWFDVSGSDSQPSVTVPSGYGDFADILEVDISGNITGTGTAIDGNNDIAAQIAVVGRARSSAGQIGAVFNITDSDTSDALVSFEALGGNNQTNPTVSDTTHIKSPGDDTNYVTQEGTERYVRTDCVNKLLKAELLNVGKITDTERIYIKVFSANIADFTGNADVSHDETVCVLSNGNPIIEFNDPHNIVTFDASESFTKASNLNVTSYYFDKDDLKESTIQSAASVSSSLGHVSDTLGITATTTPSYQESYTNHNRGHVLDTDSRFLDFYRLNRVQVADNYTIVTGQDDVSNRRSFIESFEEDLYASVNSSPAGSQKIPTSIEARGFLTYSNDDTAKTAHWRDLNATNRTSATMVGSNDSDINLRADTTQNHPKNFIFICKSDIYDRIYIRTNNAYTPDGTGQTVSGSPVDVDMSLYYATTDGWKPLEFVDNTHKLQTSGDIKFKIPSDWNSIKSSDVESGNWSGPVDETSTDSARAAHDPGSNWDFDAYAIIVAIHAPANMSNVEITNIWPYSNSHSQLTKIIDGHHVSLNDIAVTQSISYSRKGKFHIMTDRMGKSEIRKIGVDGGTIRFGSVDLGDTDSQGNRKKMKRFQQNSTPIFLDVTHQSGEKTRFFGIITDMSEDFPTGKQFPKYGISMQVSHIIELDSSNNLLSGKIAIGGNLDDTSKYLTTA